MDESVATNKIDLTGRDAGTLQTRSRINTILSERCSLKIEHIQRGIENVQERANLPHYQALKNAYEAENTLVNQLLQSESL